MRTSLHTSVRRVAVKSPISLCLNDGKPPLAQDRVCSTEKEAPQTHFEGSLSGVQPYRSASASWNAPLCKAKPCSESGRTLSQVEDPFSLAIVSLTSAGCLVRVLTDLRPPLSDIPCFYF